MKCPSCQALETVFTFQAQKHDKCGRCCNYSPSIVRCRSCHTTWCPPCWQNATTPTKPRAPRRFSPGIADESFDI